MLWQLVVASRSKQLFEVAGVFFSDWKTSGSTVWLDFRIHSFSFHFEFLGKDKTEYLFSPSTPVMGLVLQKRLARALFVLMFSDPCVWWVWLYIITKGNFGRFLGFFCFRIYFLPIPGNPPMVTFFTDGSLSPSATTGYGVYESETGLEISRSTPPPISDNWNWKSKSNFSQSGNTTQLTPKTKNMNKSHYLQRIKYCGTIAGMLLKDNISSNSKHVADRKTDIVKWNCNW